MSAEDIKVLVATHKSYAMPKDNIYYPIFVGAKGKEDIKLDRKFVRDDSGKNISEKNPNFCELTGIYWAWKNLKADYIGLCHYRRYLKGADGTPISGKELSKLLDKFDIVLPKKRHYVVETLYNHWCHTLPEEPMIEVEKILSKKYPKYLPQFENLKVRRSMHTFNIFIMKREIFDDYCKWLFDILFELEKKIDITNYNDYQKRFYGMMSERLLDVYLLTNGLMANAIELPVLNIEGQNYVRKAQKVLEAKFLGRKYDSGN